MKKIKPFFLIILFWLVLFPVFIFIFLDGTYTKKYEHVILDPPEIIDQVPTGELINKFSLEQPLNWDRINTTQLGKSDTLCIDLLLANYDNRNNTGNFSLTLRSESTSQRIESSAGSVRNNIYERFCYENISLNDIEYRPTSLLLEGIDSPTGKAISAWMTSDITQGKAILNGKLLEKSMIFSISAITESYRKRIKAIFLLSIFCGLSITALFWPYKTRPF